MRDHNGDYARCAGARNPAAPCTGPAQAAASIRMDLVRSSRLMRRATLQSSSLPIPKRVSRGGDRAISRSGNGPDDCRSATSQPWLPKRATPAESSPAVEIVVALAFLRPVENAYSTLGCKPRSGYPHRTRGNASSFACDRSSRRMLHEAAPEALPNLTVPQVSENLAIPPKIIS